MHYGLSTSVQKGRQRHSALRNTWLRLCMKAFFPPLLRGPTAASPPARRARFRRNLLKTPRKFCSPICIKLPTSGAQWFHELLPWQDNPFAQNDCQPTISSLPLDNSPTPLPSTPRSSSKRRGAALFAQQANTCGKVPFEKSTVRLWSLDLSIASITYKNKSHSPTVSVALCDCNDSTSRSRAIYRRLARQKELTPR